MAILVPEHTFYPFPFFSYQHSLICSKMPFRHKIYTFPFTQFPICIQNKVISYYRVKPSNFILFCRILISKKKVRNCNFYASYNLKIYVTLNNYSKIYKKNLYRHLTYFIHHKYRISKTNHIKSLII